MSQSHETQRGYGMPRSNLIFDGREENYEIWEVKLLAYLSTKKLKKTVQTESYGTVDAAKNEEVYSEIVQLLDNRSLSLIMRDAKDDGRKALNILREHYASKSKPRVIALYSRLWSLEKQQGETLTDYVIRSEAAANALKDAGEDFKDLMLISVVMKGLPNMFEPFIVNIHARGDDMSFSDFKVALRTFEENKKMNSSSSASHNSKIMYSHSNNARGGGFNNNNNNARGGGSNNNNNNAHHGGFNNNSNNNKGGNGN